MAGRGHRDNAVPPEVCGNSASGAEWKKHTFFQLDRRISMMIDLQLASQMPLVQAQQSQ